MELSAFVECSTGSTPKVSTLKKYIDYISAFGYKQLYLGLTNAYKLKEYPYFNYNLGGYTGDDLREIDAYAKRKGIELRASIQVLGHLGSFGKYECNSEMFDTADVLLVGCEKTYEFIKTVLGFFSEAISSRVIHIGMDEAESLGKGKYKQLHGERPQIDIFCEHLNKVYNIAKEFGLSIEMWTDMFMKMSGKGDYWTSNCVIEDNVKEKLPKDIGFYYWNYWQMDEEKLIDQIEQNRKLSDNLDNVSYAGTAWKQNGLIPYNRISFKIAKKQIDICKKMGVKKYMVTLWSDGGAQSSIFSVLPAVYQIAHYALTGKDLDDVSKDVFEGIVGVAFDDFMLIDYLNDPFFKNIEWFSTRSHTSFYSHLLTDYYDSYYDSASEDKYRELALKLEKLCDGKLGILFKEITYFCKILSVKMLLPGKIRKAYENRDKLLLRRLVDNEFTLLISYYEDFIKAFTERWYFENYPNGLDFNQVYYGGGLLIIKDVKRRIKSYIENDEKIYELEQPKLKPCDNMNEDNLWALDIKSLI